MEPNKHKGNHYEKRPQFEFSYLQQGDQQIVIHIEDLD